MAISSPTAIRSIVDECAVCGVVAEWRAGNAGEMGGLRLVGAAGAGAEFGDVVVRGAGGFGGIGEQAEVRRGR